MFGLGDGLLGIGRRRLAGAGDAAVVPVQVGCEETRARRTVRGTESGIPVFEVGIEEDDPRFFGLAVAGSAAGAS